MQPHRLHEKMSRIPWYVFSTHSWPAVASPVSYTLMHSVEHTSLIIGPRLLESHPYFFPIRWKNEEEKGRVKSAFFYDQNRILSLDDQRVVFKIPHHQFFLSKF